MNFGKVGTSAGTTLFGDLAFDSGKARSFAIITFSRGSSSWLDTSYDKFLFQATLWDGISVGNGPTILLFPAPAIYLVRSRNRPCRDPGNRIRVRAMSSLREQMFV